jgi:hypothetical protein
MKSTVTIDKAGRVHRERGVWVYRGGETLSIEEAIRVVRDAREQRDRQNDGGREW